MRKLALIIILVVSTSGCGYLFIDGPGRTSAKRAPHCSDSKGWVVVDGVFAGLNALMAISAAAANAEAADDPALEGPGAVVVLSGAVWAAVHTLAAISGSAKVDRCRAAWADHEDWLEEQEGDDD